MSKPGDACPACKSGWIVTVSSRRSGLANVRYRRCWHCGHKAPREVVPASEVQRRTRRK
jgi:hypothetical protein